MAACLAAPGLAPARSLEGERRVRSTWRHAAAPGLGQWREGRPVQLTWQRRRCGVISPGLATPLALRAAAAAAVLGVAEVWGGTGQRQCPPVAVDAVHLRVVPLVTDVCESTRQAKRQQ